MREDRTDQTEEGQPCKPVVALLSTPLQLLHFQAPDFRSSDFRPPSFGRRPCRGGGGRTTSRFPHGRPGSDSSCCLLMPNAKLVLIDRDAHTLAERRQGLSSDHQHEVHVVM